MSVSSPVAQLRRRRLGVIHLVFFAVAASAPLTVLGGGVTTTLAVTGNLGTPLSFLILALALGLFAVGYAAMSRYVANAGAFYSYLAQGLGAKFAVCGSFVALLSYNAIQVGLYGLLGYSVAATFDIGVPWWGWGLIAWVIVGALGVLRVDLNARVLAVLLTLEVIVVAIYDIGAFANPADGTVSLAGLDPGQLFTGTVGAVLAFSVAAFIGFESSAIYSEECRNPKVTVARATYVALAFTGLFYAISALAMTITVGGANAQQAATENGPGLVFGSLAENWGGGVSTIASILFVTSVFAALLSFHNGVARYLFALGREGVLPAAFSRVGSGSGGPIAGSITQSGVAVVVMIIFALSGVDPLLQMFTWLSGLSAVGVILLMTMTSMAVIGYFRRRTDLASTWQRLVAPALAAVVLAVIVVLMILNFDSLAGTDSALRWILPGLVLVAAVGGYVWGSVLQRTRPSVYRGIGMSAMAPEVAEPRIQLDVPPTGTR